MKVASSKRGRLYWDRGRPARLSAQREAIDDKHSIQQAEIQGED